MSALQVARGPSANQPEIQSEIRPKIQPKIQREIQPDEEVVSQSSKKPRLHDVAWTPP